ncbi:Zn-dependent hydrolase [Extibacter muris]|uniref:Zn-dependent hydrolase n=1 Tax=Extibacter muris TaxID=1796622 RepID=UPI001D07C96C|nr:Zn-dependent hydrolase [Extibacter muris]MCB6202544.1 Zn-dependent hydrolase [Extibacter muris]MCQ4664413.1 Zn-dependent hydrolase [Extibacter muris]MCQ4693622.1 Zn-dependent hydrolase [Extibacter muris]
MKIDIERVLFHLEELYRCGAKEDGTYTRLAYSEEDVKGRTVFKGYFEELGIGVRMDEAGNLVARLEGTDSQLPSICIGSHLDTVPDGGKYDGTLGCVAGLSICETLIKNKKRLRHPVEVIVFADEEGVRFGSGMIGSGAMCGETLSLNENDLDMYGQTRADVFRNFGISVADVPEAKRDKKSVHCFLELHVEQGISLYDSNVPVGIVSAIAGVSRYEIKVAGEANHAGSTKMEDRKDALVAAAKFIAQVPSIVRENGNKFTVATVGTIKVTPNSINVVPGTCTLQLEIRDQDSNVMIGIEEKCMSCLETICTKSGMEFEKKQVSYHKPAPMSESVIRVIQDAAEKEGIKHIVLPSGAFHDSLLMTAAFPTGMIFVPSVKGFSHSKYELTLKEDIEKGCQVLLQTVLEADGREAL